MWTNLAEWGRWFPVSLSIWQIRLQEEIAAGNLTGCPFCRGRQSGKENAESERHGDAECDLAPASGECRGHLSLHHSVDDFWNAICS
jgi:hypothetical protein